jgi:hypothetical protein
MPGRTTRYFPLERNLLEFTDSNSSVANSRRKRSLPDIVDSPASREYISVVASTSALVSAAGAKRGTP